MAILATWTVYLSGYEAEASHFVDPALVRRIGVDPNFAAERAQQRVRDQLEWIAESGVDGIVITCTAYSAAMPSESELGIAIPIITIDEPFFAAVCRATGPQTLLFTNPGTVAATMGRLTAYAETEPASLNASSELIPAAFDLFMSGRQAEHDDLLTARLGERIEREATRNALCRSVVDDCGRQKGWVGNRQAAHGSARHARSGYRPTYRST